MQTTGVDTPRTPSGPQPYWDARDRHSARAGVPVPALDKYRDVTPPVLACLCLVLSIPLVIWVIQWLGKR